MTAALVTDFDLTWEPTQWGPSDVSSRWTADGLYENMCRGTGRESTSCFGSFFNFSSPVLCLKHEQRPLVHFDGEIFMVSFVVCNDVSFWGAGGEAEIVLREGHIIGLQGKHAVHHWCHILWKVPKACRHQERWFARWMTLKQVMLSHCFYINHVCVCWNCFFGYEALSCQSVHDGVFKNLCFQGQVKNRVKNSRETPLWRNPLTPICLIFGLATDILYRAHTQSDNHILVNNDYAASSRCRPTLKLLKGELLSVTRSLLALKRWQRKAIYLWPWVHARVQSKSCCDGLTFHCPEEELNSSRQTLYSYETVMRYS